MKIILKYILNNIRDRKMRTVVMLLSIVLSTTLLFVSLCIGDSYAEAQRKMSRGMAGSATLSVSLVSDAEGNQNWITSDSIPDLPSINHAVGMVETMALYKEDGYYENFDVIAADPRELANINHPRLLDGGELLNFTGNQIVLPDRFTTKFGVEQGDSFTLWINGEAYEFTVAAIAAYDTVFLRHTRGFNALVPVETLSAILGSGEGYSEILIEPSEGVDTASLQTELKEALPQEYRVNRVVNEAQVEADARQKSMPFFLISFFSVAISVFIIFSSYKVITLERLPVIGTFRSIGATEKTVTNILMLESLVYGGLGALLGIPVGFAVLRVLLNGLGDSLSQGIDIPMVVSPGSIILSCAVAIVVSVLSAWIPVKRASRLPVKDVVLGNVEEKKTSNIKLFLFGAILLVLSIILPRIGQHLGDTALFLTGGFSLVGLLTATIITIPIFTSGVSVILERIYGALLGNEGKLAARNMRGNKNTEQNITLLFISISSIIAVTVVCNFVQVYIGDVFRGAAMDGFTDAAMSSEFVEKIAQIDEIDEMIAIRVMNNMISLNGSTLPRVEGTEDISVYSEMFAISYEKEEDRLGIASAFGTGRFILLSSDCMKRAGVQPGETVNLTSGGLSYDYTILGSFKIRSTNTDALIPSFCAADDFGAQNYGIVGYTSSNPDAVMVQIRDLFGNTNHWSRTVKEFTEDGLGTVNAFLQPMQNLTWFILILATVGIINNLLINYIQKRHATAMYKSVGMSNWQNMIMTLTEGISSGLIGAVIAMIISWLELKTIFLVAAPRIAMQPELESGTFLFAGVLGVGITLIGSIVPIAKNRSMKIVEELKFD